MKKATAVILDIDGTLLDSNAAHAKSYVEAAREMGIEGAGFEEILRMIGMGGDKVLPKAFDLDAESDKGKRLDKRKGEIFREMLAELKPTPGTREMLERFSASGLRRVVATSANRDDLKSLLNQAGVADLMEDCTSSSDVENSKPDPDIVLAALELSGSPAEEAVMIGDTPYDVEAALRAGIRIIAVRSGGWGDSDLVGATAIFDHPADLLEHFSDTPFA
jgi:HAD superfamily hydrolase (TIGR01509 family)